MIFSFGQIDAWSCSVDWIGQAMRGGTIFVVEETWVRGIKPQGNYLSHCRTNKGQYFSSFYYNLDGFSFQLNVWQEPPKCNTTASTTSTADQLIAQNLSLCSVHLRAASKAPWSHPQHAPLTSPVPLQTRLGKQWNVHQGFSQFHCRPLMCVFCTVVETTDLLIIPVGHNIHRTITIISIISYVPECNCIYVSFSVLLRLPKTFYTSDEGWAINRF